MMLPIPRCGFVCKYVYKATSHPAYIVDILVWVRGKILTFFGGSQVFLCQCITQQHLLTPTLGAAVYGIWMPASQPASTPEESNSQSKMLDLGFKILFGFCFKEAG